MKNVKAWIKIHQSAVSFRSLALPLVVGLLFASQNVLAQAPLKIMVMGDSIHHGNGDATVPGGNGMRDTPRTHLVDFFKLGNGSLLAEFIGPNTDKPKPSESGHASRGGWEFGNFFQRSLTYDQDICCVHRVNSEGEFKSAITVAENFPFDAADVTSGKVAPDSVGKFMTATQDFTNTNYGPSNFTNSSMVSGWANYAPDFVLSMLGVNEAIGPAPVWTTAHRNDSKMEMDEIIDIIRGNVGTCTGTNHIGMMSNSQTNAPLKVLLANILPTRLFLGKGPYTSATDDLNQFVISTYGGGNTEIVDVPSNFDVNVHLLDEVHLNVAGSKVVARNWIKNVMEYVVADQAAARANASTSQYGVLLGDLDGDGDIDFADYLIVSDNFNLTDATSANGFLRYREGDIDGDGEVGFSDFFILSANFGL